MICGWAILIVLRARFMRFEQFFVDYDQIARDATAMLRLEAGQNPHDEDLVALVGELSTRSERFRKQWASQDVRFHRSGRKRLRHPAVGKLDLDFEAMQLPSDPGLQLDIYTASANTPTADGLKLLASWAASQDNLASERTTAKGYDIRSRRRSPTGWACGGRIGSSGEPGRLSQGQMPRLAQPSLR
jgi:hypothetical protein